MDEKLNAFQISQIEFDAEDMDFAQLESQLEAEIDSQMEDLKVLEEEHDKIGNPATIGETVKNVVWEQFINQVGVIAGEDFIRENRGLTLDLRDSAHIQTKENFADGKLLHIIILAKINWNIIMIDTRISHMVNFEGNLLILV